MKQNSKQLARDAFNRMLLAAGWQVQSNQKINLATANGVPVRKNQTDIEIADYEFFVDRKPEGYYEAKQVTESLEGICNLWEQSLDYFDVFQFGLTTTPDNRTFSYFDPNLVSDCGYENVMIDGVQLPYNVFTIETKITKEGGSIPIGEKVDKQERLVRRKSWESVYGDIEDSNKQLDKDIVN